MLHMCIYFLFVFAKKCIFVSQRGRSQDVMVKLQAAIEALSDLASRLEAVEARLSVCYSRLPLMTILLSLTYCSFGKPASPSMCGLSRLMWIAWGRFRAACTA